MDKDVLIAICLFFVFAIGGFFTTYYYPKDDSKIVLQSSEWKCTNMSPLKEVKKHKEFISECIEYTRRE